MGSSRRPKVGDHVYHHPSGDYLGVVTDVSRSLVYFDGPRVRDGHPVTIAGHTEVRVGHAPDQVKPRTPERAR